MKKIIILYIIFRIIHANAEEQWFCKDDSASRNGNTLSICGVGTAPTEGDARERAFDYSIREFRATCAMSSDCKDHKVIVDPKRSTCIQKIVNYNTVYICHRLFNFTIQ